jgi:thymidylate kinase
MRSIEALVPRGNVGRDQSSRTAEVIVHAEEMTPANVAYQLFRFDDNSISYCVVGDVRSFPEEIDSDIDIVVEPSSLTLLPRYIQAFCDYLNIWLVQCIHHESNAVRFDLTWKNQTGFLFLSIDICGDFIRSGYLYLTADEMLGNRRLLTKGKQQCVSFYVPGHAEAFIYYLHKKIDKQELSDWNGSYLYLQWTSDPKGIWYSLRQHWKEPFIFQITRFVESQDWNSFRRALPELRNELRRTHRRSINLRFAEWQRLYRRYRSPTGLVVAFLGPDGSGKSSVVDALGDMSPTFRQINYFHFRACIGCRSDGPVSVTNPHGTPPRSAFVSMTKLCYYLVDYWLGFLAKVRPRIVRSTLVVFDRYYQDLLVDPLRYRYGGPPWLAMAIGKLVPRPDLWILLDAPAKVLQYRKSEVSEEESARACMAYKKIIGTLTNARTIDASKSLSKVVADVQYEIFSHMSHRTRARIELETTFYNNTVHFEKHETGTREGTLSKYKVV